MANRRRRTRSRRGSRRNCAGRPRSPRPSRMKSEDTGAVTALTVRRVAIDTYRENVAYLHRRCPLYLSEGFQALSKIEVRANGRSILATLNIVDDAGIVAEQELGLSEDAFVQLGAHAGTAVQVDHAPPPASTSAWRRKIEGERLSRADYHAVI